MSSIIFFDEFVNPDMTLDKCNFPYTVLSNCKNIEMYGGAQNIWERLLYTKGHYIILENFRYFRNFNEAVENMFLSNEFKYKHLLNTMVDYNPLDPYHITEEHAIGNKQSSNTITPEGTQITKQYETSFNNLDPKLTGQSDTSFEDYKTVNSFNNDVEEHFKDVSMQNLTSSEKKYVSREGNIGNHALSDLLDKERKSVIFSLWDIICNDIVDLTCYKIFN